MRVRVRVREVNTVYAPPFVCIRTGEGRSVFLSPSFHLPTGFARDGERRGREKINDHTLLSEHYL